MSQEIDSSPPPEQDVNAGYKRAARMIGIASVMGIELAVFVAGSAFLGQFLQERFGLGTWVTLVCVGVAGLLFIAHMRFLLRRNKAVTQT